MTMTFPVFRTTFDALEYCWRERWLIVRYAGAPFLLALLVSFAEQAFSAAKGTRALSPMFLVTIGAQLLIFLPLSVTWYRIVVLGESEARNRGVFTFGRREWRFLLWQVLLGVVVGLFGGGAAVVIALVYYGLTALGYETAGTVSATILALLAVPSVALLMTRLSLVLVLAALDQPVEFKTSWRMTAGLAWRLFAALLLVTLAGTVFGLLFRLVGFIVGVPAAMVANSALSDVLPYVYLTGQAAGGLITLVGGATLFGFVYRMLTANVPLTGAPNPGTHPAPA